MLAPYKYLCGFYLMGDFWMVVSADTVYLIERFKERKIRAKDFLKIVEIEKEVAYDFVRKYHYLGDAKFFSKYSYGLFCNQELLGCATYACPQGSESLKGWFGLPNNDKTVMELTRLCMLPILNGTNATSFLLGGSIRELKKEGIRAITTLATSDRHVGSIYQICNFKYYGLTAPKSDFWAYETQGKPRGKVKDLHGCWVAKPRKHRYAYIIDPKLKCLYNEQKKPPHEMSVDYSCCGGSKVVHDRRYNENYTCPICTGRFYKIVDGEEVPPKKILDNDMQLSLF